VRDSRIGESKGEDIALLVHLSISRNVIFALLFGSVGDDPVTLSHLALTLAERLAMTRRSGCYRAVKNRGRYRRAPAA
jgi:hypothetical protein